MSKLFNLDIEIPTEEMNFFLDNVKIKKFKKGEFFHFHKFYNPRKNRLEYSDNRRF